MDIWDEIKKLSGYQSGNGGVDSYGVDHSGFSTRDDLEYQSARLARENQLAENFSKQGIAEENYPQFGTNFWGGSLENNYGFGTSNISQNIQNVTNQLNNSGFNGGTSGGFNNGTNNGQTFANSDYTVNTESLVGKPSSYFQNNNTGGFGGNNNTSGWNNNTVGSSDNTSNGFNQNANFGTNPSYGTTPTLQNQTSTPWNYNATQPQNNIQQQLRMPAGTQQQITMPSYELQQQLQQPQTSAWDKVKNAANNFAGGTEAFSVGYATGATLGNFDEGMGAATAALTGNRNNYTMGRDATRQLQNNLQQQHPIAYGVGEFTGAMMTPMHLTKGENFKQKAFNALTDTLNASAGYAENWNDFGTNLAVNGIANIIGLTAEQLPLWRASARPLTQFGKKFFKQGINSSADKMKNMHYKKDEDEEEYYY